MLGGEAAQQLAAVRPAGQRRGDGGLDDGDDRRALEERPHIDGLLFQRLGDQQLVEDVAARLVGGEHFLGLGAGGSVITARRRPAAQPSVRACSASTRSSAARSAAPAFDERRRLVTGHREVGLTDFGHPSEGLDRAVGNGG